MSLRSKKEDRWAVHQAMLAGDSEISAPCAWGGFGLKELSPESDHFSHLFAPPSINRVWFDDRSGSGPLTSDTHQYDFVLTAPRRQFRDFSTYYADFRSALEIQLSVTYPEAVHRCMYPDAKSLANGEVNLTVLGEDPTEPEAGLWDMNTRVGESPRKWHHTLRLSAVVPISVGSSSSSHPDDASAVHYLTPGAPSPLILARSPLSLASVVFPISEPVVIPEPLENTSARLLQHTSNYHYSSSAEKSGPAQHYNSGPYAAVLWKKKLIAEERGFLRPSALEDQDVVQVPFGA